MGFSSHHYCIDVYSIILGKKIAPGIYQTPRLSALKYKKLPDFL